MTARKRFADIVVNSPLCSEPATRRTYGTASTARHQRDPSCLEVPQNSAEAAPESSRTASTIVATAMFVQDRHSGETGRPRFPG